MGIQGRRVRQSLAVLVVAMLPYITSSTPAHAANLAPMVMIGTGTVSPALTMSPQWVSGGFAGSAVGGGLVNTTSPMVQVALNGCSFSWASTGAGDDLTSGQGTESGACNGTASVAATSLTYSRIGATEILTGTGTVNGVAASHTIICIWIPTSAPAVGRYIHVCVWVIM